MGVDTDGLSVHPERPSTQPRLSPRFDVLFDDALVLDARMRIAFVGAGLAARLGRLSSELKGHPLSMLLDGAGEEALTSVWPRLLKAPRSPAGVTASLAHRSGRQRVMHLRLVNLLQEREVAGVVVHAWEAADESAPEIDAPSERRLSEPRLSELRTFADMLDHGVLVVDAGGETRFVNSWLRQHVGESLAACLAACDTKDRPRIARLLDNPPEDPGSQVEVSLRSSRGEQMWVGIRVKAIPADAESAWGSLVTVTDITPHRVERESLEQRAFYDALTGLANRSLFDDRLAHAIARRARRGSAVAVVYCDLDGLKRVNDKHGHSEGDRLLREVAGRLSRAVRSDDTVARLGGDEFAVVCEDVHDAAQAAAVAERIIASIGTGLTVNDKRFEISISVGVATSPPVEPADLVPMADRAMYRAKRNGGNQYVMHGA